MRSKTIASLAGLLISTSLAATDVQAAPFDSGGYPRFTYEGRYPESTPCRYRQVGVTKTGTWAGRKITLKYFYNANCGSFARIDNAPSSCYVLLDRTRYSNNRTSWEWVGETVDPGLNFAYTKVGSNLAGRLSRGALVCGNGTVLTRTNWY